MGIFGSKELDRKKQPVEPKQEPAQKKPCPIPPPVQAPVWIFYTANSQAYRVGAKVHAARAGQLISLCHKLNTDRAVSVQEPPEEAMCAPCRAAMQRG